MTAREQGWGGEGEREELRLLVACDLDLESCKRLVEECITGDLGSWDLLCALGPFCGGGNPSFNPESLVGEMTSILAQLENIVCRVVYSPASGDPVTQACATAWKDGKQPPRLTTTSKCLHGQRLGLVEGLCAAGFAIEEQTSLEEIDTSREERLEAAQRAIAKLCAGTDSIILLTAQGEDCKSEVFSWRDRLACLRSYRENVVLHLFAEVGGRCEKGAMSGDDCKEENKDGRDAAFLLPLQSLSQNGCFYTVILEQPSQGAAWRVIGVEEGVLKEDSQDIPVIFNSS